MRLTDAADPWPPRTEAGAVVPKSVLVHASTVAFGSDAGILIEGPSGSGKSRLALALVACGAQLVADDRSLVFRTASGLFVRPPRSISGLIEARGVGILRLAARRLARAVLVIGLQADGAVLPRLPDSRQCERLGRSLPWQAGPGAADEVPGFARALALQLRHGLA